MKREQAPKPKSLLEKGFDFDKRFNTVLAVGATAVYALIPAASAVAAVVAAGSIAGIPINDRARALVTKKQ